MSYAGMVGRRILIGGVASIIGLGIANAAANQSDDTTYRESSASAVVTGQARQTTRSTNSLTAPAALSAQPAIDPLERAQMTLMVPPRLRDRLDEASSCSDLGEVVDDIDAQRKKAEKKLRNAQKDEKDYRRELRSERKNPSGLSGVKGMYKSMINSSLMTQQIYEQELSGLSRAEEYAALRRGELACPVN